MTDRDRLNLVELIEKLRSVTLAVQVIPFAYTAIYILVLSAYPFVGEAAMCTLDTIFYISPTTCAAFLVLSKMLRLCKWHRMACILPITPQVAILLDRSVIRFSNAAVFAHISITVLMAILLLVAAYNVFLKPKSQHNGRKRRTDRDSRLLQIQT